MGSETKIEAQPTRAEILRAAEVLAGQCDGAVALDGMGYNSVDSPVAKSIMRSRRQTDRQLRTLWSILGKYRAQLERLGVDYGTLVPPSCPPRGVDEQFLVPANRVRLAWVDTKRGNRIAIVFAYDPKMNEFLKGIRKSPTSPPWFDAEMKAWVLPDDFDLMDSIAKAIKGHDPAIEVVLDPELQGAIENARQAKIRAYEESRAASASIDVPTKLPLYPFQMAAVKWIEDRGGRALLADDMGIGKTVQALGYLARHPEALPALIVCPATLRANWYKETIRFTSFRPLIVSSKTSLRAFLNLGVDTALGPQPGYDIVIVNYDLFEAETPAMWVRALERGDKSVIPNLLQAGQYAMKALNNAYAKSSDIEAKTRLLKVIGDIARKGSKANRRKFIKVFANGTPLSEFLAAGFQTLVCDEIHYLKDTKSQRSLAMEQVSMNVKNVIGLTGTPILNRPIELWSQVHIVNPKVFPDWMRYAKDFCGAKLGRFGLDVSGATNLERLDHELRVVMLRRLKKDVLTELPEKIRITIPIALDKGMKEYQKEAKPVIERLTAIKKERDALKDLMGSMGDAERATYLAAHAEQTVKRNKLTNVAIEDIEKLKAIATSVKFDDSVNFILDAHEQQGKIVVFMVHHETIDRMVEALEKEKLKVGRIDGRVPVPAREPIKDAFQDGDTDILVCGIRAASEGLTLTASHTVITVEFDWNAARHQQCEDRVHRIGQTVSPTMYYLVAMGTIEERIVAMIDAKSAVVNSALGEGERTVEEHGILDAILDNLVGGNP